MLQLLSSTGVVRFRYLRNMCCCLPAKGMEEEFTVEVFVLAFRGFSFLFVQVSGFCAA